MFEECIDGIESKDVRISGRSPSIGETTLREDVEGSGEMGRASRGIGD